MQVHKYKRTAIKIFFSLLGHWWNTENCFDASVESKISSDTNDTMNMTYHHTTPVEEFYEYAIALLAIVNNERAISGYLFVYFQTTSARNYVWYRKHRWNPVGTSGLFDTRLATRLLYHPTWPPSKR